MNLLVMMFGVAGCVSQPVPPPMAMQQWPPPGNTRGVIVALHSFGDYRAAFNLAAPALARRGYRVYAFDQAGFGTRNLNDCWAGEERLVDDAARAVADAARQHPGQPLYLLGESLGGAVAILVAQRHPELPIRGLILAAPAVREGIRLRYGWNVLIASAAILAPGYRLTVNRAPDDPLLAPEAARRLADDPRVMRRVRMDSYWG
ncbi:alpha/beta hydrolase [Alcanivorax sp. N3-2A]|nr:alpha/beta hydrolase [Alcanivorax sp. N3-2A]